MAYVSNIFLDKCAYVSLTKKAVIYLSENMGKNFSAKKVGIGISDFFKKNG